MVNLEKQLLCHHFAFLNPVSMCGTWWGSPIDNAEQLAVMRDYVVDAKDSIKSLAEQCKSSVAVSLNSQLARGIRLSKPDRSDN